MCGVLSGLLQNEFSVRNSKEFADLIDNFSVNSNEILVAFDDVSLFTSVRLLTSFWDFSLQMSYISSGT